MKSIRYFFKRSRTARMIMALVSWPVIFMLTGLELLFKFLSDWYIKRAFHFYEEGSAGSKQIFCLISRTFMPHRLTDKMAKTITGQNLPLQTSLASSLFLRNHYNDRITLPEWRINNKISGRKFARSCGLSIPDIYFERVSYNDLPVIQRGVIKPVEGCHGTGVFIVETPEDITEINSGIRLNNWDALQKRMRWLLANSYVSVDSWLGEEYITDKTGSPAPDIKFSLFYGQIGWIVKMTRHPKLMVSIFDSEGRSIYSELYKKSEHFLGDDVSHDWMSTARRVSLEIPAPFMRIDFLERESGLVFCEFTPRPGVIGFYKRPRDHFYGQLFHEAEARLITDLIQEKGFDTFKQVTSR